MGFLLLAWQFCLHNSQAERKLGCIHNRANIAHVWQQIVSLVLMELNALLPLANSATKFKWLSVGMIQPIA